MTLLLGSGSEGLARWRSWYSSFQRGQTVDPSQGRQHAFQLGLACGVSASSASVLYQRNNCRWPAGLL
jgi:hypothetical protein